MTILDRRMRRARTGDHVLEVIAPVGGILPRRPSCSAGLAFPPARRPSFGKRSTYRGGCTANDKDRLLDTANLHRQVRSCHDVIGHADVGLLDGLEAHQPRALDVRSRNQSEKLVGAGRIRDRLLIAAARALCAHKRHGDTRESCPRCVCNDARDGSHSLPLREGGERRTHHNAQRPSADARGPPRDCHAGNVAGRSSLRNSPTPGTPHSPRTRTATRSHKGCREHDL
jgi:hypothetical protein